MPAYSRVHVTCPPHHPDAAQTDSQLTIATSVVPDDGAPMIKQRVAHYQKLRSSLTADDVTELCQQGHLWKRPRELAAFARVRLGTMLT